MYILKVYICFILYKSMLIYAYIDNTWCIKLTVQNYDYFVKNEEIWNTTKSFMWYVNNYTLGWHVNVIWSNLIFWTRIIMVHWSH